MNLKYPHTSLLRYFLQILHPDRKSFVFRAAILVVLLQLLPFNVFSARYYSRATGTWSSNQTWSTSSGGQAVATGVYPGAGDEVYIERGFTVTVNMVASCTKLNIGRDATLGGGNATRTGFLAFSTTGSPSLTVSGNVQIGGSSNSSSSGTITFVSGSSMTAGTLTLGNASSNSAGTLTMSASSTLTMNGAISLGGTGTKTWTPSSGTVVMNATNTLPAATVFDSFYNLTIAGGTTSLSQPISVTGTLTINPSATFTPATNLLTLSGNLVNSGTFTSGSGGVTFSGTANQSIGGFSTTGTVSMIKTAGIATLQANVTAGNLLINGSGGTLNLGSARNHTLSGNVTLTAGVLDGGSSVLNVNSTSASAWSGTGSVFTASTGTVAFGGGAQTLSATSSVFNNLTFSGSATKTLGASMSVNGTLTLNGALLLLGSNNLTLGASSPAVAGTFSSTNMIVATGTGELRKTFTANGSYTYPVGDNTGTAEYSPITLNFLSGSYASAYAGVKLTNGAHPNLLNTANYLNRYWSVSQSGISAFSCNITASYTNADVVGTLASLISARYSGSLPWARFTAPTANTLTASAVSSFGDFTAINNVPYITSSASSLSGFSYPYGVGPSTEQSFTVGGSELTANIRLVPPTDFEISTTSGANFSASSLITLTAVSGVVNSTPIYVRLKAGLAQGSYPSEIIDVSSTGATSRLVSCSGSVAAAPTITPSVSSLSGFSYVFTAGPSTQQLFTVSGTNLPAAITLTPPASFEISTTSGANFQSTPIMLNPVGGTVSSTTIYVRLKIALSVGSYSENIVLSTTGLSTNVSCSGSVSAAPTLTTNISALPAFTYTTGSGPSGEQSFVLTGSNLSGNVTVTPPANFALSTSSGTGFTTSPFTLSPTGGSINRTLYVRMIAGLAAGNYGPSNVSLTATGAVVKTVGLSGSVVNSATILTSKSTLTGFGYMFGTGPSGIQELIVSGSSLTSNITVTPPANFEISTSQNGTYVLTPLTLTQSGGRVNPTSIYVRLKAGLNAGNYTGTNISITATGATTKTVSCVGVVFTSPLITAGGGGEYCQGSSIPLTSTGSDIVNRYWQGPDGFYSTLQNPTITGATTAMSGTYSVTGNVYVGGNLVTNGDFESGNTSFGSSYGYATPATNALWNESLYTVVANPTSVHNNFSSCVDHTIGGATPTGNQMVINGAPTPGVVIWSQSVPVVPDASYEFSYWVQTVCLPSPSMLQLYVNGVAAGPVYTAEGSTCLWKQFVYNTKAGSSTTSVNLELINQNTAADGNDFALDDIVFKQILVANSSTTVTVNPTLPVSVSIAASANPVYANTPVTYTATPTNGGTAPVYQWKVNGVVVGTNSTTYTYTPSNGDVVSCQLTSNYPCPTGNPATASLVMTVNVRVNYWMGSIDTDWGKTGNWTANTIPLTGDDVEYATVANYGSAAVNDLRLDIDRTIGNLINATTKRLIIPATKCLTVNSNISTDGNPARIYIHCDSLVANGSLIFHNPSNLPVYATVEMYAKGFWDLSNPVSNNRYHWQYVGIPIQSITASPSFDGAYVRRWDETGTSISNHWVKLANNSVILPFYGYELCQRIPKVYYLQGQLVNTNFSSGQLAMTPTALYPGQHVFANPYTAAIDIRQLTFGTQTEATVYMYNAGTFYSWTSGGQSAPGSNPGQYTAASKNLAGYGGVPRQVPSMQAMLIKAMQLSSNATFGINYNAVTMSNTTLQRAPSAKTVADDGRISTQIEVKGKTASDKMWIFTDSKCSGTFDNGYDAQKFLGSSLSPQLYLQGEDANYQIAAVNDMHDSRLGFQAGVDTEYEMKFIHTNTDTYYPGIYLVDIKTNSIVDITESGTTYSFNAQSTPTPVDRFRIVARPYDTNKGKEDTEELKVFGGSGMLFIHNFSTLGGAATIYDMSGRKLKVASFSPLSVSVLNTGLPAGAYIVKCVTDKEDVSKRVVIR